MVYTADLTSRVTSAITEAVRSDEHFDSKISLNRPAAVVLYPDTTAHRFVAIHRWNNDKRRRCKYIELSRVTDATMRRLFTLMFSRNWPEYGVQNMDGTQLWSTAE